MTNTYLWSKTVFMGIMTITIYSLAGGQWADIRKT